MAKSQRPFSNGVSSRHLLFLGVFLALRICMKTVAAADRSAEGSHEEGFEVFHVDFDRVSDAFTICLWIFIGSVMKIAFHALQESKAVTLFPESCLLIIAGIIVGIFLVVSTSSPAPAMSPQMFLIYLLPPIILEAGYFMPNRLFFDHIGTILLMAVVGTVFNMVTIGASLYACGLTGIYGEENTPDLLETFLFASLIVAVDPVAVLAVFEEVHVDEILYIVVFGESLLNDAVTIVLYNVFTAYIDIGAPNIVLSDVGKGFASFFVVAMGGTFIGVIGGYFTGLVTRFTNHVRSIESLFVVIFAYTTYLSAETFHFSGILALTFCGITMKNYVHANISSSSQVTLKYMIKMLANISETLVFIFLGISTINNEHNWNWPFVLLTILFCTVFRAVGVVFLVAMANPYRLHKLKVVDQFVMLYGGLRGAISFALVVSISPEKVPHANMFVTTTIAVVFWTVFIQGTTIKPLGKLLNIKQATEKDLNMNERLAGRLFDNVSTGIEAVLGSMSHTRMRKIYKDFDDKYIKPLLVREPKKDPKIEETFQKLTDDLYKEMIQRNPTACFKAVEAESDKTKRRNISGGGVSAAHKYTRDGIVVSFENDSRRESSTDDVNSSRNSSVKRWKAGANSRNGSLKKTGQDND